MLKLLKTRALVLRSFRFGEKDRLLTLLSPELGKISAKAPGACTIKSKLSAGVEPLTVTSFLLHRGKTMYTVSQLEVKQSNANMRENIVDYALGLYLSELVEKTVEEGEACPAFYRLLANSWHLLNEQKGDREILARCFELKMLDLLGYRPYLEGCIFCGNKKGRFFWSKSIGGIFCEACSKDQVCSPLSGGALAFLRSFLSLPIGKIANMRAPLEQKKELEKILQCYFGYWTGIHSFKTLDFLRKINNKGDNELHKMPN